MGLIQSRKEREHFLLDLLSVPPVGSRKRPEVTDLSLPKRRKKRHKRNFSTHRSLKNTSGLPSTSRSLESSSLPVLRALMSSKVISSGLYSSRQAIVALFFGW